MAQELLVRRLGLCDYEPVWQRMCAFTEQRTPNSGDELWILEHPPIFTLGRAADPDHVIAAGDIPVLRIDRGGQVTYHGPGQLVFYTLLDLQRLGIGVRRLVTMLEKSVIDLLADMNVNAYAKPNAPGVYVETRKIAALGLRVRRGCCYHGLSVNVDMNLEPFARIHPCGYADLSVTRLVDFDPSTDRRQVAERLTEILATNLGYTIAANDAHLSRQPLLAADEAR